MPEFNLSIDAWSPGKKQVFRFSFIFLLLYILINPNNLVPYFYLIQRFIRQPFYYLIDWLGDVFFKIPGSLSNLSHAATDTAFSYLVVLFTICIACVGSVVWMFIDKKSTNYNKANDALIIILRYYLGITWIAYATAKVTQHQFSELTPIALLHTYGNSPPRELAWNFMGYSTGFNYFTGIAEYIIGILLFFRRTYTFGNLIGIGALVNVLAFNYYFDDNVKLLSTMVMVMSLVLLSKDLKRLVDFFFRGKTTSIEATRFYHFDTKGKNLVFNMLKYGLIIFLIFFDLHTFSAKAKQLGYIGKKPPLYGVYDVKTFIINRDTLKPLTTDTTRWSKLIISSLPGKASIMQMNNDMRYFAIKPDTTKKTIQLIAESDTADKYIFSYVLQDSVLSMRGKYHDDLIEIQLKQFNLDNLPLVKHKSHWIIEPQEKLRR
jgi:uncharacterized membrane protein YphA (DoxX/SURF4 family)